MIWLWLWVCFAGGIGLLAEGDPLGLVAIAAGVITLGYGRSGPGTRWIIRVALVVVWLAGGLLLWGWTVEDWSVALRIAFGLVGGTALLAALLTWRRRETPR